MLLVNHIVVIDDEARIQGKEHLRAEMVARMIVDGDHSIEDAMRQYDMTAGEVHAALTYYYDNQADLDSRYNEILAEIRQNAMTLEKFKRQLERKEEA
jgi:uncharacterized protein (DUF433 family)